MDYYILDSLDRNKGKNKVISDYPISNFYEVASIINNLKQQQKIDDNYELTNLGLTYYKELYKELKLNRYIAHIYPEIDELI